MNEDNIILFQKYVEGALSDQESKAFMDRLASDAVFKSEFEMFQMMEAHLEDKVKHSSTIETIKSIGEKHREEAAKRSLRAKRRKLGFFILGLLLLGFFVTYYFSDLFKNEKPSFAELYVDPNWQITKGDNKGLSKALVDGVSGNVEKSIDAIRALDLNESEKSYWMGEVYLKNKKYEDALESFSGVVAKDKEQRDRLNYLKIVCHHLLNDMNTRNLELNQIPSDTNPFYKKKYLYFK